MKKKTIISAWLLVIIPVLYFSFAAGFKIEEKTVSPILLTPTQIQPKDFINCIFNSWYRDTTPSGDLLEYNFSRIKELNFNAVHRYSGSNDVYGFFQQPLLDSQKTNKIELYDSAYNKNLNSVYGSPNTEYLCYGQRLEYEAEGGNNGFSYQRRMGGDSLVIIDSNRSVVHLSAGIQQPGFLCDSIYENLQHGDGYVEQDFSTWFIKPMIRIPVNTPDETPIVKILVVNFQGDTIKQVTIKAKNFKRNGSYNGFYT
jgi:hypothetical protein